MATKKQKRRRAKEQRHDYVWIDDEGNEVEPDGTSPDGDEAREHPASPARAAGAVVEPHAQAGSDLRADHVRHRLSALARPADGDEDHADAPDRRDLHPVQLLHRSPLLPLDAAPRRRAGRRPPRKLTRTPCSASNSSRSDRSGRTATSSARRVPARRRRWSSTRAATRPSCASRWRVSERAAPRSSSRTGTSTTCSASPTSPRARERRSTCPRASGCCSSSRTRSCASRIALRAYTPDVLLVGGETVDVAGIAFEVLAVPGHSPAHVAYHADGCLFSGDVLFAGSVGRTVFRAPTGRRCSRRSACLVDTLRRHGRLSGHGPITTLGDELADNPFLASCARSGLRESRVEGSSARAVPRRHSLRAAALAAGDVGDRDAVRAVRLPPDHDARLRGPRSSSGRPAPAPTSSRRRCTRSRIARTGRSRCAPRRPRRSVAPTSSTGCIASRSREALHDRVDVPLRRARQGRYREHWQASVEAVGSDDPSIDAELIQLYDARSAGSASRATTSSSTRSGAASAARRTSRRCARGSTRTSIASTRRRARRPPRARSASSTTTRRSLRACALRSTTRRRSASRSARCASSASPSSARTSTQPGWSTGSSRRSCAASTTTRGRPGVHRSARERERDALGRRPLRLPRRGDRRAADAESASAPGSSALLLAMEEEGVAMSSSRRSTSSSPSRRVLRAQRSQVGWRRCALPESRATRTTRTGLRAHDTGRRLGAATTVVVVGRQRDHSPRRGADEAVAHGELLDRLSR